MHRRIVLSQNFLTSPHLVERLLDRSSIGANDVVYEIGPGTGTITERLARRCRHVIAVEKAPRLARRLAQRLAERRTRQQARLQKSHRTRVRPPPLVTITPSRNMGALAPT